MTIKKEMLDYDLRDHEVDREGMAGYGMDGLLVSPFPLTSGVKLTGKLLFESSAGSDRHRMLNGDISAT